MTEEVIGRMEWSHTAANEVSLYAGKMEEILGDKMVGLYIGGSFARGGFQPATSDIDLILVVSHAVTAEETGAIQETHKGAEVGFDTNVAQETQAHKDVVPTPIAFVMNPAGEVLQPRGGAVDFLINRQDVYEAGVTLSGKRAGEYFRPVPWETLSQALEMTTPCIIGQCRNSVLNLCRILYAFENRKLCSKQDGGVWAKAHLDREWQGLIDQALSDYAAGLSAVESRTERLSGFEDYCSRHIAEAKKR